MKKLTEKSLHEAFAGESQAHMKYLIFSKVAEDDGKPNIAKLFKAISYAEQVHATNHLRALNEVQETEKNLQVAIDGETFETDDMYPAYKAISEVQEENAANRSFDWAMKTEKIHAGMYEKAKQAVLEGKDIDSTDIYICSVCGYTTEKEMPETCPICGAPKAKFIKF